MPTVPNVTLNNGVEIPQLGFGVFQIEPADTVEAVRAALGIGYRHIDTAEMYGNEREVGEAIARSGLARSDVFVTSKLNNNNLGFDAALRAFDRTLAALGTDRIDLFLIHWPLPTVRDYVETWKALETLYAEGRVRAIGVSNFQPDHLLRVLDETEIVPAVNQIEVHPYLTQEELLAFDAEHGIATEAWSPIAQGAVLDDPVVVEVAERPRTDARPGGAALARPARAASSSPSRSTRSGWRRTSPSSTSSSPTPTWSGSPRSTAASAPARTRTPSTTCPADPLPSRRTGRAPPPPGGRARPGGRGRRVPGWGRCCAGG